MLTLTTLILFHATAFAAVLVASRHSVALVDEAGRPLATGLVHVLADTGRPVLRRPR